MYPPAQSMWRPVTKGGQSDTVTAEPLLERLAHPNRQRPTFPTEGVVDAVVDVVLLVEREAQPRARARQQAVHAEVSPLAADPADAAECHEPEALPPVEPVLGLCGEHAAVLKLARRVAAHVVVEAEEAEVVEGDAAVGRAGHRPVGQDLSFGDLPIPVIADLVDLIFPTAPPHLVEEVGREVEQVTL